MWQWRMACKGRTALLLLLFVAVTAPWHTQGQECNLQENALMSGDEQDTTITETAGDCCQACVDYLDQVTIFPDGGVVETACNAWSFCKNPDGCDDGNIPTGTCSLKFQFGVVNLEQMIFGITLDILLTETTDYDSGFIDKSVPIGPPVCNAMTDLHFQDINRVDELVVDTTDTVGGCCDACLQHPTCNMWRLCNNELGCGGFVDGVPNFPLGACFLHAVDPAALTQPAGYPEFVAINTFQIVSGFLDPKPPVPPSPPSPPSPPDEGAGSSSSSDTPTAVIASVTGSVGGLVIVTIIILILIVRRRRQNEEKKKELYRKDSKRSPGDSKQGSTLRVDKTPSSSINSNASDLAALDQNNIVIVQAIGKGRAGNVFQGTWKGTAVAIKKIPFSKENDNSETFRKEVSVLAKLRHPNIVTYIGYYLESPYIHIVMELMERGSLETLLASREQLSRSQRLSIATDVVRGMAYLHENKVIHRDLKPANVLISSNLEAKIGDFGLSYEMNEGMSSAESLVGTPGFMAPEVLNGMRYKQSADVWSFGALLSYTMTGEQPFGEYDAGAQILAAIIVEKKIPDYKPVLDNFDADMKGTVEICCSYEPSSRPSFRDLLRRFEEFTAQEDNSDQSTVVDIYDTESVSTNRPGTPDAPSSLTGQRRTALSEADDQSERSL